MIHEVKTQIQSYLQGKQTMLDLKKVTKKYGYEVVHLQRGNGVLKAAVRNIETKKATKIIL